MFIGTKAQYVKTAPLLRLLDERGVAYRLIDSGQHGAWSVGLREQLGVRAPDLQLGGERDITTIAQALRWSATLATELIDRAKLRREVFGIDPATAASGRSDQGGVCVVHGDTPSTLLSALLAKRAGLAVAHLEAGLRSGHLLHPFPEELIRVAVMRVADLLFAPDATAVANLARMRVRGEVIALDGNTVVEALAHDLRVVGAPATSVSSHERREASARERRGSIVVTMHRVENLNRRDRVGRLVALAEELARSQEVTFVCHGPTAATLAKRGLDRRLAAAGVELTGLLAHTDFVARLAAARLVITDGGSVQEECALLGVPTLLWRAATERPDGVGANVVVSGYDPGVIERVVADPESLRRAPCARDARPSEEILARLQKWA